MNAKGFTLIETIVVLVLTGLLAAVAGVGISTGARSFVAAREASELAQEAQLAMDRLTREIMELVDIPANSSATLLVVRNVGAQGTAQFNRSIQYVANAQAIRIADGTGGAANGDTLIDNVTAFSLTYWQEDTATTTWASTTDARQLSAIDIDFTLTAPGGTTRRFVNRIVPRNNENRGGASPNSAPPSLARYDVCFVATAAAGDGDHPVVVQLREFRDRLLLPWSGGRALVRAYYAVGPDMARVVAAHEPLRAATLAVLTPVAALAGLAVHAPGWLAACVVLSALLVAVAGRALRRGHAAAHADSGTAMGATRNVTGTTRNAGQRGAVLLSAIVTIVAFSVLAATMVPMMTGSMMGEIAAVQGDQAYYLAESGFGAAGSMFLAAGDEQARKNLLETMDGSTYTLAGNAGSFTLGVEPYWYEVTGNTGTTLTTRAYGTPPTLPANTSGRIRAGTGGTFYAYSNISVSGDTVTFTLTSTPSPLIASGTDIFLSAQPSANQTVTERGNLALTASNAAAFPTVNGMFTIRDGTTHTGRVAYVYRRKNGSTLEDVRLVEGQGATWSSLALTPDANITLEAYLRLHSTGTPPGGLPREIIYNVPIGWILGGGNFSKEKYQDTFDNLNAWYTGSASEGHLGTHAISSGALRVTSMQAAATTGLANLYNWFTGSNQWSTLFFNWGYTSANLAQGWADAEGNSSYDLQFKAQVANQSTAGQYFGGLLFRGRNSGSDDLDGYGISFVRFRLEQDYVILFGWGSWYLPGDIPSSLIPGYNSVSDPGPLFTSSDQTITTSGFLYRERSRLSQPAIMLWERRNGNFRWLAYKLLGQASGIITYNSSGPTYSLKDWSTMLTRLVEGQELSFRNGGGASGGTTLRINYGDEITTTSGAKARVIGPPIVTSGDWASGTAQGTLVLTNVDTSNGSFGSGQAIKVDNVQHAVISTTGVGSKANFIRVYYADNTTSSSTTGDATPFNPTSPGANTSYTTSQRIRNPRLTSSDGTLNWIPDDYEQWTASTDHFSLVQWDGVNSVTGLSALGERLNSTNLANTIIRSSNLLSPAYDASNPVYSPAEGIAIVTSGPTGTNFYFDDFGLQLDLRGGKGFLPPIQQ
ncbi:type II secretion system protein [Nitratidesulfovibrio liaohensis]|uniref:Prepilin-type N-terminal cleavage/methylation domain-containing protein n=1 Tax=Nitratidesulfovibrio liaohensis TaxID=2604158 RepID=A0ABY9R4J9_9BACT|nr:type II secretion system protein [Nitratidesulfovibrio liaohensis]WMW66685.1 prepilin-type N-terminal cleavage/methylation domain-containing protein [Nitratidesulfovibrio liaohensis]